MYVHYHDDKSRHKFDVHKTVCYPVTVSLCSSNCKTESANDSLWQAHTPAHTHHPHGRPTLQPTPIITGCEPVSQRETRRPAAVVVVPCAQAAQSDSDSDHFPVPTVTRTKEEPW
jgi:hypothetical protein